MSNRLALAALLFITSFLVSSSLIAQVPQGIPYQAMIRGNDGAALVNANVTVRFTLHQNTTTGPVEYQETQSLTTNAYGLINTQFGTGTPTQGTFAGIVWSNTSKFIQVEANDGNGFVDMGTQQMMSVPFAMYAAQSGTSLNSQSSNSGIRIGISQNSTWTCPPGVTNIQVELWGGGGGGGGCNAAPYPAFRSEGGAGGSGGYVKQVVTTIPGQVYQITIGNGGVGGLAYNNGQPGGISSFDNILSTEGGSGGVSLYNCNWQCSNTYIVNGAVINCDYFQNYSVTSRSYIPVGYITNFPYCGAQGGGGTSCGNCGCGTYGNVPGNNTGFNGENGYCILSY